MSQTGVASPVEPGLAGPIAPALVLAVVAIAAPVSYFLFAPLLAVAVVVAVIALVLSLRARARGARHRVVAWTIVFAVVGLVVDLALFVVAIFAFWVPRYDHVEVRAAGSAFVAVFADDSSPHTMEWEGDDWFQRYTTERSWVELVITRAPDATGPVSCTILWNDVVVVEESSSDGAVLCRYEVGPFGL